MCGLNNPIAFTEQYFSYTSLQTPLHCLILISTTGETRIKNMLKRHVCLAYWCLGQYAIVFTAVGLGCVMNTSGAVVTTHTLKSWWPYGERGPVGGGTSTKNTQNTEQTTNLRTLM